MADNTTYTTNKPTRWDEIAYIAYGDASRMQEIIDANVGLPLNATIAGGTVVNIPIVDATTIDTSLLPPWKR